MTGTARSFRRFIDDPLEGVRPELAQVLSGKPLGRNMTRMERTALAVAYAEPTNYLTLDSPDLGRDEISSAWSKLRRRINRRRRTPWIYLVVPAVRLGASGHHLHVLLWEYIDARMLRKHIQSVGFGGFDVRRVSQTPLQRLHLTSYVLGQNEPVLGSTPHQRHAEREKSARPYLLPHVLTLEKHQPKLLSALNLAHSESTGDEEMISRLTTFREI